MLYRSFRRRVRTALPIASGRDDVVKSSTAYSSRAGLIPYCLVGQNSESETLVKAFKEKPLVPCKQLQNVGRVNFQYRL